MDKKRDFIVNIGYFFVWGALIYFGITLAAAYLLPFLFGIIIAYFVQKPAKYFSFKLGVKKQNCAAILSVLIFVLLATLICLLSWILISQFSKVIKYLSDNNQEIKDIFKGIYTKIENLLVKIGFKDAFKNIYEDAIDSVAMTITTIFSKAATTLVKKTPTVFLSSVVTIVATYYISKDYDRLLRFVKGFVKPDHFCKMIEIKVIFYECFLKFSVGYLWLFLITFGELSIGFLILGFDKILSLAFLIAILDLMPVLGTGTVLIPWAIIEFLQNNFTQGVALMVLYLIVTIVRNVVEPKIIGKQMDINPLFTLIFIFIGFKLSGVIGMILLPIIVTVIFTYLRRNFAKEN